MDASRREGSVSARLWISGVAIAAKPTQGLPSQRRGLPEPSKLPQRLDQLPRDLTGEQGLGPAAELDVQLVGDLHLQLASVQLDGEVVRGAAQVGGNGRAGGAGARGKRLPHTALEDPCPHAVAADAEKGHVGSVGEKLVALDLGPDRAQLQLLEGVGYLDRALRIAERDVLECPFPASCAQRAASVGGTGREVIGRRAGPPDPHRAGALRGDCRPHRPRCRVDREAALIRPAMQVYVERRLAGAVARQLRLRAVGIEYPQLRHGVILAMPSEQQDAVRADAEMGVADPFYPLRRQLPGQDLGVEDQVVVAKRLPLFEVHAAPVSQRVWSSNSSMRRATSASESPLQSIESTPSIRRIQVSWRRA